MCGFYCPGVWYDEHCGFRGFRGGEEPGTKPSVHVELEAHQRATPLLAGAHFLEGRYLVVRD